MTAQESNEAAGGWTLCICQAKVDSKEDGTVAASKQTMQDKNCRPALADTNAPVADADIIFVGYPVWWYREPSIIDSFLEAYDFTGKKIVLFATSGSSDIGNEAPARAAEITKVEVLPGKRFSANASADELKAWAQKL